MKWQKRELSIGWNTQVTEDERKIDEDKIHRINKEKAKHGAKLGSWQENTK
jgi:hypothetical protein